LCQGRVSRSFAAWGPRRGHLAGRDRRQRTTTHLRYLAEVLAAEVDDRTVRRRTRRINDAKFPRLKRLADFNVDAGVSIQPATLGQLATGHYMDACEPVAQLVNELVEAADERVLSRAVGRYRRIDLLCLDELGYVQIDPRGAALPFQIITEHEQRTSIAIATNLPFSEWGSVSPGTRLVAAIVDRVTFKAPIIETGTQSYRLRASKTTARRKRAG
jgi:DNA replication protein DnaC